MVATTETAQPKTTIHTAFGSLHDIRQQGKVQHPLINVIFIALCGMLCGADDWVNIAEFGRSEEKWLSQFLDMPHGTPSHDVFGTVFGFIFFEHFSECFSQWIRLLNPDIGKHLAIDGKYARGSKDGTIGKAAIDVVSVYATECGLTIAQRKVDDKSNEITAIPELLKQLEPLLLLEGSVITIDAIGLQTNIVNQIDLLGAFAIISLKGNQGNLHEDTEKMFDYFQKIDFKDIPHTHFRQVDKGHGRIEIREGWAFDPRQYSEYFRTLHKWPSICRVVMLRSERQVGDKVQVEVRYFISTLDEPVAVLMTFIRQHWGIENGLHWVLDVAFREDTQRVRKENRDANLVTLRHLVLNLLRLESSKRSIETKRLKCGWNTKFRMKALEPILNC